MTLKTKLLHDLFVLILVGVHACRYSCTTSVLPRDLVGVLLLLFLNFQHASHTTAI